MTLKVKFLNNSITQDFASNTSTSENRSNLKQKLLQPNKKFISASSTKPPSKPEDIRFFELELMKKPDSHPGTIKKTPVYFCDGCDILFATAMRLLAHQKLCTQAKTAEKSSENYYICKKCQVTSTNIISMYVHVKNCKAISQNILTSVFTCFNCRNTCASLGEMEAHFDVGCSVAVKKTRKK
uniref:CSON010378 protein n=1 Tax=Culicoides sonorensis TaxID=179676 RepID=A0A336K6C6_CULSO